MSANKQSKQWTALQEQLAQTIKALDALESEFQDVPTLFEGSDFPEQTACAVKMENLFIAATHETATSLSFLRQEMDDLANFIAFRKQHCLFSSSALLEIIDDELSTRDRQRLWHEYDPQASFFCFYTVYRSIKEGVARAVW